MTWIVMPPFLASSCEHLVKVIYCIRLMKLLLTARRFEKSSPIEHIPCCRDTNVIGFEHAPNNHYDKFLSNQTCPCTINLFGAVKNFSTIWGTTAFPKIWRGTSWFLSRICGNRLWTGNFLGMHAIQLQCCECSVRCHFPASLKPREFTITLAGRI